MHLLADLKGAARKTQSGKPYLAHIIICTATRHELEYTAEVGFACTGSNELDYILVPDFPHDSHFLQIQLIIVSRLSMLMDACIS